MMQKNVKYKKPRDILGVTFKGLFKILSITNDYRHRIYLESLDCISLSLKTNRYFDTYI